MQLRVRDATLLDSMTGAVKFQAVGESTLMEFHRYIIISLFLRPPTEP